MPRYIDAEKLEKDGWSASRTYQQDAKTMVYETKKMTDFPAADVEEVVRCKDCWHRIIDSNDDWCECTGCDINPDGFCEEGERRDDG